MSTEAIESSFAETTKLVIKQKFETLEALANVAANALDMDALGALGETANKYDIFTDDGGLKFRVVEESSYCGFTGRVCCKPFHELKLHVYQDGAEVMHFDKPCKGCCGCVCCACCGPCQLETEVYAGDEKLAHVQQPLMGGLFSPTLQVMDREGERFATIKSNAVCCIGGMCCDHTFVVEDDDGNELGKITKERPDSIGQFAQELVSDADVFTMEVPKDMEPQKKAAMLASLHLIDYWLFENEGDVSADAVEGQIKCKICDMYCCGCICPCSCACGGGGGGDGGGGEE